MPKAALVLVPVGALVALGFVLLLLSKGAPQASEREASAAAARKAGGPGSEAELARLRAEVESLRKEKDAQRKRAEEAEAKLATPSGDTANAASAEAKKEAAKKGDWKKRRDAELEAKVKSMEWRKHAKSIVEFWKANEKARADGRQLQFTPELQIALSALQADMTELYKFMGMEGGNSQEVFKNEVVGEAYMDAFMQELTNGTLTEDQLAKLRGTDLYKNDMDDWDFTSGNILERWKDLVTYNQGYTSVAETIVSADQLAQISAAVTPTFMLSIYAGYSEKPIAAGTQAAPMVTDYWMKSFKLPDDQRAAVEAAAAEFIRRQAEIVAQYPGTLTRESSFEILLKTMEAQIAAEKMIAQSVQVDPELAKKLLKGSGAVIKIGP